MVMASRTFSLADVGAVPHAAAEEAKYRMARALGVHMISDVYERLLDFGVLLRPGPKKRERMARMAKAGVLFIHVPKNAGMSVSDAIYGCHVKHASFRYYARAAPVLAAGPSVAILRDPVDRFLSAYNYGRVGGVEGNRVSRPFDRLYATFRSIDDALDHVEAARSPYDVDHIFRPQSWYVTDHSGRVAVTRLLLFSEIDRIANFLPKPLARPLNHLNRVRTTESTMTDAQAGRLRAVYAHDFALFEALQASRWTMEQRFRRAA